jgi:hypothetical protein
MLKGKATIKVSKQTVIAAVQMYLDTTFKEKHTVTNVKTDSYSQHEFEISLDDGSTEDTPEVI